MKVTSLLFASVALLLPCFLWAEADPAIKLQNTIDAALDVFYEPDAANKSGDAKRQQIASLISESYDLSIIMRRAMGRNWKKLTEMEQNEMHALFEQLVIKVTYDRLSSGIHKPKIHYDTTTYESDNRVRIPSSVTVEGSTYNVVYRMGRLSSGWQIYDIIAEDISFVSNYRQQLDDHFRRKDGAALIKKLKERLKSEENIAEITI